MQKIAFRQSTSNISIKIGLKIKKKHPKVAKSVFFPLCAKYHTENFMWLDQAEPQLTVSLMTILIYMSQSIGEI